MKWIKCEKLNLSKNTALNPVKFFELFAQGFPQITDEEIIQKELEFKQTTTYVS